MGNHRKKLIEAYDGLDPLEQSIVQLFSVIYDNVTRTSVIDCLRKSNIRAANGKAFTHQSFKPLWQKLLKMGLIVETEGRLHCRESISEEITRRAVLDGHFNGMAKAVQAAIKLNTSWGYRYYVTYPQMLREIRIAFYNKDLAKTLTLLEECTKSFPRETAYRHPYVAMFSEPFDANWFDGLPEAMIGDILARVLDHSLMHFEPATEACAFLEEHWSEQTYPGHLRQMMARQWMLKGKLDMARRLLEPADTADALALRGSIDFLGGANENALERFEAALTLLKKTTRKRKIFLTGLAGVFFIMALLRSDDSQRLQQARDALAIAEKTEDPYWESIYRNLLFIVRMQQGEIQQIHATLKDDVSPESFCNLSGFFYLMTLFWLNAVAAEQLTPYASKVLAAADNSGYPWFAAELAEALVRMGHDEFRAKAESFHRETGTRDICRLFTRKEPWEHVLRALTDIKQGKEDQTRDGDARLVWWLNLYKDHCTFEPREQKLGVRGHWTKGRPVSLKRLYSDSSKLNYLTPQDLEICAAIRRNRYDYYYGGYEFEFNERKALSAMVGHPLLFWESNPEVKVELVKGEPELLVTKRQAKLHIALSPQMRENGHPIVVKETPTRLKLVEFTKEHKRIAELLDEGLEVPAAARERVQEAIASVSRVMNIQSNLGGGVDSLEEIPGDPQPHLHLLPFGEGLKVEILVKPFAQGGPYYRPGSGGERVIAEVDGKRLQAKRNLRLERQRRDEVIEAVPTLERVESIDGEWTLEDPENCLEALVELQALGDSAILEWPEGEKLKVSQPASFDRFKLKIRRQQDWFNVTGELALDDARVLDMRDLLELARQTPSRFLPLGEGRFLALTREFRKRLDELNGFTERTAKGARFHPLAALALEDLTTEAGSLQADKHWKEHLQRLREAESLEPEIPSTLQGELRDYQVEGFQWLARLAHWGVGACLADDMGLGKTIQALTLILSRARQGPSLAVAPTSVCMNWTEEARRFAPTLNVMPFGGGDRRGMLESLGPFDLLVCSYGLLQQEAEMLAGVHWATIVLDEAQAIKNMATKRSQAAMALGGDFRMITTGTPIENHLGELWNLFRFINRGLLGSHERFNQRFAIPIERDQDKPARTRLKKLIQPFILRRAKTEVLDELPSRTEILLHVEMGKEEAAFYEALRLRAVEKLTRAEEDSAAGPQHLQILAEIMKLRRACCNPNLVMPDAGLPSAKLAAFEEKLEELLENRHKALVFSQFVDHLGILRELLDAKGVGYQYLDGSTPAPERKRRVDAFQAGQGDVFLISLKAGGLGLNLTAADYVIHMDPWWNPAVEDQAADRAHRIGQQRPVTIYRLVMKDTIEDKIVALHHHKRDLASSLLEGAGVSGKLSAEALLRLLRED